MLLLSGVVFFFRFLSSVMILFGEIEFIRGLSFLGFEIKVFLGVKR